MYKYSLKSIILLIIFASMVIHAQEVTRLNNLRQKFESFQYDKVISAADSLLNGRDTLSRDTVIEIYLMKGISHFSLEQDEPAKKSFTEILKLDSAFKFDSAKTSPKIITFFNNVKKSYDLQLSEVYRSTNRDTIYIYKGIPDAETRMNFKNTILRSMVLPGWGHLYNGSSAKGTILTSLGALSIISSVYFIFDCNSKEEDYINETNIKLISDKYNKYNTSYKLRNYSLITLAAVWLYAQLDLLLFSNDSVSPGRGPEKTGLSLNYGTNLSVNYYLPF